MGGRCSISKSYPPDGGHFVIEAISASNVPKSDYTSESDPYLTLQINDENGKRRGQIVKTSMREDTANPIWHSYRDLKCNPLDGDVLHVTLWDCDVISSDDMLANINIPISKLIINETLEFNMEINPEYDITIDKNITVSLRHVPYPNSLTKTLYIIRHGESKWNAAQAERDVGGLMAFDHGLNEEGISQAVEFNQRWKSVLENPSESESEFLQAPIIFSSPLTRALQTGIIALQDHQSVVSTGVTLLRNAREVRNLGGLDTMGIESGENISKRAYNEMALIRGDQFTNEMFQKVHIDPYDAISTWWVSGIDMESEAEMTTRFYDFLCSMHFYPFGETAILTGHSLFFKQLCNRYMSDNLKKCKPELAQEMKGKLENAGCLRLLFDFSDDSKPEIIDAELMFGSKLLPHHN